MSNTTQSLSRPALSAFAFPDDPKFDVSEIKGNAADKTKRILGNVQEIFRNHSSASDSDGATFTERMHRSMEVIEISVNPADAEPKKMEGKVIIELTVHPGTRTPT